MSVPTTDQLHEENESLRQRLTDAEETLRALAAGEVDAVVVGERDRDRVLTLELPDMPYRFAVEQMLHPAVTLTHSGTIIYGNRRFAELLGMPVEALPGQPLSSFVSPGSRAAFETLLMECGSGETSAEVTMQGDSGTPVVMYLGATPMRTGALGACVVVTDLTSVRHYEELRETQDALRASERQLRDADRRKDELLATLAHELRNPLLPMRSAVEILRAKPPLAPELEMACGILDRQVRLMSRLLDDLLDVARITRHTLDLRIERVALSDVLEAALETSRPLIDASGHTLVLAVPDTPIYLRADPVRLSQVFSNLLNNAAKYTETGGRIDVVATEDEAQVTISIKDTGIGISRDMLPHVFEIFTQGKLARDRAQGGIGIGLSLVKGLVELHGGSVAARSDGAGRGSEFIVRLPRDA
jgi:PAS domain S-box-containing protein